MESAHDFTLKTVNGLKKLLDSNLSALVNLVTHHTRNDSKTEIIEYVNWSLYNYLSLIFDYISFSDDLISLSPIHIYFFFNSIKYISIGVFLMSKVIYISKKKKRSPDNVVVRCWPKFMSKQPTKEMTKKPTTLFFFNDARHFCFFLFFLF